MLLLNVRCLVKNYFVVNHADFEPQPQVQAQTTSGFILTNLLYQLMKHGTTASSSSALYKDTKNQNQNLANVFVVFSEVCLTNNKGE